MDARGSGSEGTYGVESVDALGQSESFLEFQECLSRVAKVERPVLLVGERGTGKELAALRLHYLSLRWREPLVALNCAALSPALIESELFGHEEGAFTGARARRSGRFEAADGGTLLLDEIGLIPRQVQEKILRVVEYGGFERVGSSDAVKVDVRIIGATNANLPEKARKGEFMADLLDRLSFEVIFVPPLRERQGDVPVLAGHFAARMAHELGGVEVPEFSEQAQRRLENYPWPGNVRELKNVVERAVYRSGGEVIAAEHIVFDPFESPYLCTSAPAPPEAPDTATPVTNRAPAFAEVDGLAFEGAIRALEFHLLRRTLDACRYNQREAADKLGLTYHQFRGLYRKYKNELAQ
jgi:psp operon transcriptional activator